jgi:hypothetical protein
MKEIVFHVFLNDFHILKNLNGILNHIKECYPLFLRNRRNISLMERGLKKGG